MLCACLGDAEETGHARGSHHQLLKGLRHPAAARWPQVGGNIDNYQIILY